MNEIEEKLLSFHCPRWEELPDIQLYVDQVVSYIEMHLTDLDVAQDGKLITASMINNYVKMKLIPAMMSWNTTASSMMSPAPPAERR